MLNGLINKQNLDTFNKLYDQYQGTHMCETLSAYNGKVDPLRSRNIT